MATDPFHHSCTQTYQILAPSSTASNGLVRSMIACLFPIFAHPIVDNLGTNWGGASSLRLFPKLKLILVAQYPSSASFPWGCSLSRSFSSDTGPVYAAAHTSRPSLGGSSRTCGPRRRRGRRRQLRRKHKHKQMGHRRDLPWFDGF